MKEKRTHDMRETCYFTYDTELGKITVICSPEAVVGICFGDGRPQYGIHMSTALIDETAAQLDEYFRGERKEFNLPLSPEGTEFQKKVWDALTMIPYGETRCYQDVAIMTGNPKATRAVGMANNKNPIPVIIPCHRVIGKDGSMTGYGGGLEIKKKLLLLEKNGFMQRTAEPAGSIDLT